LEKFFQVTTPSPTSREFSQRPTTAAWNENRQGNEPWRRHFPIPVNKTGSFADDQRM
jgi:hypothetical protein